MLECVPVLQRLDATRFSCNIWVREVLTLRGSGKPEFMTIPQLCTMGNGILEQEMSRRSDPFAFPKESVDISAHWQ